MLRKRAPGWQSDHSSTMFVTYVFIDFAYRRMTKLFSIGCVMVENIKWYVICLACIIYLPMHSWPAAVLMQKNPPSQWCCRHSSARENIKKVEHMMLQDFCLVAMIKHG